MSTTPDTSPFWKKPELHGLKPVFLNLGTFAKHGVLVAHNEMDYLKPVEPGDRLIIRLGASGLGNSSIHIRYEGYVLKKEEMPHIQLWRSARPPHW